MQNGCSASSKDKTLVYSPSMEISTQFIWAPYAKRHNKDLGGDTRKVFPYEAIVGELFGDGESAAATDDALKDIAVSRAGGLATAQLVKRVAM